MPHVVNGIGTWYYGKNDVQQYQGTCRWCRRTATLTSYTTRLFFVVVFVPIIPLAKKRIIEQCSACKRHAAVPFGEWSVARERIDGAIRQYANAPADPNLAKAALQACVSFRDPPAFIQLASQIEPGLASNSEILCLVGGGYMVFARDADAERLFRKALAIEDTDEIREAIATCLVRQGKPEEAEPFVQHVIDQGIPDRVDALYQLAQGFQRKGQHDKALQLFAHCPVIDPNLEKNPTFIKLRNASADRVGTSAPMEPGILLQKEKSRAARGKFFRFAGAATAIAAIVYLATAWYLGIHGAVYVANGLSKQYAVQLNGTTYALAPLSTTKVWLGEGDIRVELPDAPPGSSLAANSVSFHTSFWTRPFSKTVTVLNPDQCAVIADERVSYASSNPPPAQVSMHGGELIHQYDDIDYAFEKPPSSLQMDANAIVVHKQVLEVIGKNEPVEPSYVLIVYGKDWGNAAIARIAENHLLLEPEQNKFLLVLAQTLDFKEQSAFLRAGLSRRPIDMQWHRCYQQVMEASAQDEQAEHEYDVLLATDPSNKELIYLAGRAALDPSKTLKLYQQAVAEPDPCAFAFFSLGNFYCSNAQFPQGADDCLRALHMLPKEGFDFYVKICLLADNRIDQVAQLVAHEEAGPSPDCIAGFADDVYLHALRNDQAGALAAIEQMQQKLAGADPATVQRIGQRLRAQMYYVMGDLPRAQHQMTSNADDDDSFWIALTQGDFAAAQRTAEKTSPPDPTLHLLVYLSAIESHHPEVADPEIKKAIELLGKGDFDSRAYAAALAGKPSIPIDELLMGRQRPVEKAALLAALGTRDQTVRDRCFAMARKLNFDKRFPYRLIDEVTGPAAAPAQ